MSVKPEIRVVTYMCPTHPVQLYELILELLEEELNCYASLQYESRKPGPLPDRPDPFSTDKVDLGKSFARPHSLTYLICVMPVSEQRMNAI